METKMNLKEITLFFTSVIGINILRIGVINIWSR